MQRRLHRQVACIHLPASNAYDFLSYFVVSAGGDDGCIIAWKCLRIAAQVDLPTRYKLIIKTGSIKDAGTRARVHAVIKGERGSSGHVDLVQSSGSNVLFQLGGSDSFDIITDFNLGELQSLEIGHDNSGKNPEWFLETATVIDDSVNSKWTFMAYRWLARQQCRVELQPTAGSPCPYTISVFTANAPDSGTTSAVTVTLTGDTSQSQEMQLTSSREHEFPFQRGYCDTFEVLPIPMSQIFQCRLNHDHRLFHAEM